MEATAISFRMTTPIVRLLMPRSPVLARRAPHIPGFRLRRIRTPLLVSPSNGSRIASAFYTSTSFSFNINITDGQTHQLALYLWDLENGGRLETLSILNASTNAVLATKAMSGFGGGTYAVFNIAGNVTLQVTFTGNVLNAVLSGLFFTTPPPPPTVNITAPITANPQSGTISITANATAHSPAGMASVQFQVDGNNLGVRLQVPARPSRPPGIPPPLSMALIV